MQNIFVISLVMLALSGCDAAINKVKAITNEPVLEFAAGYKINVNGKAVPIAGFDDCTEAGKHDCVVLSKDRAEVTVKVGLPTGSVVEQWVIIRETGETPSGRPYTQTSLRRPDGSLVSPAATPFAGIGIPAWF